MKKYMAITIAAIALIALIGIGAWSLQDSGKDYSGKMDSINIGTVPVYAAALIYIAEDQQFFEENGIIINVTDYPTGIATTDAMLMGDTDLAWVAEFPLVRMAFAKDEIAVIAVVGRFQEQYLFGRNDRGIHRIANFEGKKIGIPRNTIAEFYLGRYLQLHGIDKRNITLVDVGAAESLDAIVNGRVDGVVAWEPFSSQIRMQMADHVIALPIQNNQPGYGTVVGRTEWLQGHPNVVHRFLTSLYQAETYCTRNPAAAKEIMRNRLNFDEAFTETIWSENQISLSLDQSLIVAMEDEGRWMIANNMTNATQVPDFTRFISTESLENEKPGSVNIISGNGGP